MNYRAEGGIRTMTARFERRTPSRRATPRRQEAEVCERAGSTCLYILVTTSAQSRLSVQMENAALRHQLCVYRHSGQRPRIRPPDRLLWSVMLRLWEANPTWGSPKIVAELAMLGINVAKSTVEKYQPKRAGPSSPTWRTFLDQHDRDLV